MSDIRYFCTYFDRRYLPRGLALYQSLVSRCPSFQLWVLCMDQETHSVLTKLRLPNIHLVSLESFEKDDQELLNAKKNRSLIEYYFTCSPSLPIYVLNIRTEIDIITYLDADLYFFSDPAPIFEEMRNASVTIIEHRFPPELRRLEKFGIYNVGWVSFRRDVQGLACLNRWRRQCLEWCHDRVEGSRYADQKYLDDWPTRFQRVVVSQQKGANLAPWNVSNYRIRADGSDVRVDEHPLMFFHFQGFKRVNRWLYDPNLSMYKARASRPVRRLIVEPYIQALSDVTKQISPYMAEISLGKTLRGKAAGLPLSEKLLGLLRFGRRLISRRYVVAINRRVL